MAYTSAAGSMTRPMSGEEKKVIFASSLGTVFEWYDFYLYGSLATFIGANFFADFPEATRNIFTLLAFAAGFLVRPFGALVFGRLGDLVGRKYTFLVTILIMGLSTFLVGLIPGSASIGILAPALLIGLRLLQGLAIGGEYGGAATYVAEHAPDGRRGFYTSWIQTTATLGLFLSLLVILAIQVNLGKEAFASWGWRVPFLVSSLLLGISVWIRMKMNESPAFKKMKEEGKQSKAPISEAFGQWKNAKIAIIALFGAVAGQAVVWYSGQFYALFFLTNVLKVDAQAANILVAIALALGTFLFVFFGWLSDKIGRKPIILAGMVLAALTYFPIFHGLTEAANPALANAQASVRAQVTANPSDCHFQFNLTGTAKFTSSCDIATSFLTKNSVPYDVVADTSVTDASVKIGNAVIPSFDAVKAGEEAKAKTAGFEKAAYLAMQASGYPLVRDPAKVAEAKLAGFIGKNPELKLDLATIQASAKTSVPVASAIKDKIVTAEEAGTATEIAYYTVPGAGAFKVVADPAAMNSPKIVGLLFLLMIYVTMVYGPMAAMLVEMFPTRIRYTGLSLPYHIGNGWFGGLLPATAFAMSAATGNIYFGLWYPVAIAAGCAVIGLFVLRETRNNDVHA
nr:MFS transporter [uncultured Gellertiella sp.]